MESDSTGTSMFAKLPIYFMYLRYIFHVLALHSSLSVDGHCAIVYLPPGFSPEFTSMHSIEVSYVASDIVGM